MDSKKEVLYYDRQTGQIEPLLVNTSDSKIPNSIYNFFNNKLKLVLGQKKSKNYIWLVFVIHV